MEYKSNKTIYIQNHRKPKAERKEFDFYATHPKSVISFLDEFLKGHSINTAWEPACGNGNISEVLKEYGINVHSTDLVNRGYGHAFFDFLEPQLVSPQVDAIITNPPFILAEQFIKRAIELKPKRFVIMYLKLTFLEGKKRYKLFQKYQPSEIYVHSSRQGCSPFGETDFQNGGSVAYAWYVWRTDRMGPAHPYLFWLPPN